MANKNFTINIIEDVASQVMEVTIDRKAPTDPFFEQGKINLIRAYLAYGFIEVASEENPHDPDEVMLDVILNALISLLHDERGRVTDRLTAAYLGKSVVAEYMRENAFAYKLTANKVQDAIVADCRDSLMRFYLKRCQAEGSAARIDALEKFMKKQA